MRVLVNGAGNIGTTLLQVLSEHRDVLGVSDIYAHRTTIQTWDRPQLERLSELGVEVVAPEIDGLGTLDDVRDKIDYVFDATRAGGGRRNRGVYEAMPSLVGASAQGTEKGFGTPYMVGLGVRVEDSPFAQVVSCNTHAALAVLMTLSGGDLGTVAGADFVVARRSDDIANHERLVSGNVVARHLDPELGTHHAIDANDLLRSVGIHIPLQSSDITTPSQFLHSTRFSVRLTERVRRADLLERMEAAPYVGTTEIFDTNKVFEIGRRFGVAGRLYNQAIFVTNNLLLSDTTVTGWAFAPQEGNTIVSTLSAFLRRTRPLSQAQAALETVANRLVLQRL